jgi:hypothetical protein
MYYGRGELMGIAEFIIGRAFARPEHKPVRRGREVIDLLAVKEPKPKPAKMGRCRRRPQVTNRRRT